MVGTMARVVYGGGGYQQRWRWLLTILLYTVGTIGAAMILGTLLGFLGRLLPLDSVRVAWGAAAIGLLALLYALHELRLVSLPYPQRRRQVPAEWRYRFPPYVTALLFGAQQGLGYMTFVAVATLYVVSAAAVLYGSPVYGAILFGLFGLGRAGLLWPLAWHARTLYQAYRTATDLIVTKPLVHLGNGWALAFSGAYLLATRMLPGA